MLEYIIGTVLVAYIAGLLTMVYHAHIYYKDDEDYEKAKDKAANSTADA